jgi:hypothetical protein
MPQFPPVPSHVPYHPDPHAHLYNPFAHVDHPAYGAPVHPPQYWGGYPPTSQGVGVPPAPAQLSERTIKRGKRKAADSDDAPPSKKRAIQLRGENNHTQGLAHQAPAPPFYPATFPLVETYHPHTQQGLWQQTPAEESVFFFFFFESNYCPLGYTTLCWTLLYSLGGPCTPRLISKYTDAPG